MNLYSIKPHDQNELRYVTATSYGNAVRRYKIRRAAESHETRPPMAAEPWPNWKDVPEPSKVVMVCDEQHLISGRE